MEKPLRLHIGCGRKHFNSYVNIDKCRTSATDVVTEAWNLHGPAQNYDDGTIDEIYTSHMIEHLTPFEFQMALREWHRVLKLGGKLQIQCPNFELYVREWLEGDYGWRTGWGITNIFGWSDRGPGMMHKTGFTKESLEAITFKAGFATKICRIGETRPQTRGTIEYRDDGDLHYEGIKVQKALTDIFTNPAQGWIHA